ncbi:hypothetical protein, partial [Ochrobactrum sp. SFR4]|uniref:hypothetical protein n=1 Tax=Ochrobactrum sp. SFR4 TaxID=2717368 RepID=UPI001C8C1A24
LAAIAKANNQFIIMGADGTIAPMPINDLIDDIGADISTLQSSVSSLSVMVDAYRLILTSDVTINVSTSGADANGSLTNPFKT